MLTSHKEINYESRCKSPIELTSNVNKLHANIGEVGHHFIAEKCHDHILEFLNKLKINYPKTAHILAKKLIIKCEEILEEDPDHADAYKLKKLIEIIHAEIKLTLLGNTEAAISELDNLLLSEDNEHFDKIIKEIDEYLNNITNDNNLQKLSMNDDDSLQVLSMNDDDSLQKLSMNDDSLQALRASSRIKKPTFYDVLDDKTDYRTKAVLLSPCGMKEVNNLIDGEKLFFFFDFNNMGPPNDFGLSKEIDLLLAELPKISANIFGNTPYEVLRLGGDEFGIIVSNNEDNLKNLALFKKSLEEAKDKIFSDENIQNQVEASEKFATVRNGMRELRGIYRTCCKSDQVDFTLTGFKDFLLQYANKNDDLSFLDQSSLEKQVGELQKYLVLKQSKEQRTPIMTISSATVNVGENPDPDYMQLAIGQADKIIHDNKRNNLASNLKPVFIGEEIQMKNDDLNECENFLKKEKRFTKIQKELQNKDLSKSDKSKLICDLNREEVCDSSLLEVIRLDLAKSKQVYEILDVAIPTDFIKITLDIDNFGVINNTLGYKKGDEVFAHINEIMTQYCPKDIAIRTSGGANNFLVKPQDFNIDQYNQMITEIENYLMSVMNNDEIKAEISERQALNSLKPNFISSKNNFNLNIGTFKIKKDLIKLAAKNTIQTIF